MKTLPASVSLLGSFCLSDSPDDIWISMPADFSKQNGLSSRMFMATKR